MSDQNNSEKAIVIEEEKQDNSVVRFLFEEHGVRGEIMHMHEPVKKLLENINHYPDCIKSLMLELASAAVLIAATLKADGTVTVQIQCGKGPKAMNFAFINIDKNLNFYGNVSWDKRDDFDTATFRELVGEGGILVISAFPEGGNRYQGIVSLDKDSISQALESYFKDSEQLPTTIRLYNDIGACKTGGILLQIIPEIENNLESLDHLNTLCATLSADELFDLSLNESLRRLYWNDKIRVFDPECVAFKCICSHERIINAISGLPVDDLAEIAADPDGIDMTCNSCGRVYHVVQEEVQEILNKSEKEKAIETAAARESLHQPSDS